MKAIKISIVFILFLIIFIVSCEQFEIDSAANIKINNSSSSDSDAYVTARGYSGDEQIHFKYLGTIAPGKSISVQFEFNHKLRYEIEANQGPVSYVSQTLRDDILINGETYEWDVELIEPDWGNLMR